MPKPQAASQHRGQNDDYIRIGLAAASLLRRIKLQGNPLLDYYFEMAWYAFYQSMDEATRRRICESMGESEQSQQSRRGLRKGGYSGRGPDPIDDAD